VLLEVWFMKEDVMEVLPDLTISGSLACIIYSHFSTRIFESLHAEVILPLPIPFLLNRLPSSPLFPLTLPPLSCSLRLNISTLMYYILSTFYSLHPHPSSIHSLLYTSLRSFHANQTAIPRPNLPNDETQSRFTHFRIWENSPNRCQSEGRDLYGF